MFVQPIKWLEVFIAATSQQLLLLPSSLPLKFPLLFPPYLCLYCLWDSTDVRSVHLEIYIFLRIKGREGCTNIYRQNISKPDRRRIWEELVAARIDEEFFPLLVNIPLQIEYKSCNRLVKDILCIVHWRWLISDAEIWFNIPYLIPYFGSKLIWGVPCPLRKCFSPKKSSGMRGHSPPPLRKLFLPKNKLQN